MFSGPAHMPHLGPGIHSAKEQTASIKIRPAMMNDPLRPAVVDTDEFGKAGETDNEGFGQIIIEPIGATASQRRMIAARVAVFLELDRRYKRLSFEGNHAAIEAVDDPALHIPRPEIGFQPIDRTAPRIKTPRAALRRHAGPGASSRAERSGMYNHSDSAPGNPGAPVPLPKSR